MKVDSSRDIPGSDGKHARQSKKNMGREKVNVDTQQSSNNDDDQQSSESSVSSGDSPTLSPPPSPTTSSPVAKKTMIRCDEASTPRNDNRSRSKEHKNKKKKGKKIHGESGHRIPEKWDTMNEVQIRRNAWELLQKSPNGSAPGGADNGIGNGGISNSNGGYRSYHDNPSAETRYYEYTPQPSHSANLSGIGSNHGEGRNGNDDSLSIYHVASLALNCMTHCLTESYRAASNYYSGDNSYNQPYSTSHGGVNYNYHNAGGYYSDGYNGVIGYNGSADGSNVTGNEGSYQTVKEDHQRNEATSRNLPQSPQPPPNLAKERNTAPHQFRQNKYQNIEPAVMPSNGEYATVHLPSTYQGGGSKVLGEM